MHGTFFGLDLSQEKAQEGRFAASVRPDHTNLVPAHDFGREVPDQDFAVISVTDMMHFRDQVTGRFNNLRFHADASDPAPLGPFLRSQPLQRHHAALVASPSRLDALPDPEFFLFQFFLKPFAFGRLRVQVTSNKLCKVL
jgi:hypothetical protein